MKITIIGGTGHIGKSLVPMLTREGCQVTVASRSAASLPKSSEWSSVKHLSFDYESQGWAKRIKESDPEVLVDLLQKDSPALYAEVKDSIGHFVVCGSIWMFGMSRIVPTPDEIQGTCLCPNYTVRFKQMLEVKKRAKEDGVPFTALMEPNICGPNKVPLDCKGARNLEAHRSHQKGEPVGLPAPGNALIGPCDVEDVAQSFFCAIMNRKAAAGELFNVGAAYSLTITDFVKTYGRIYGTDIPIKYVGWDEFIRDVVPIPEAYWHFQYNMCPDIGKIRSRLGYQPKYTPEQAMERAVQWMKDTKML